MLFGYVIVKWVVGCMAFSMKKSIVPTDISMLNRHIISNMY